jgi:hypothetical protein
MKRKAKDYPEDCCDTVVCCSPSREEYPYGLRIRLGNQELEKLNIDLSGMSVGDSVAIIAQATVTGLSENEYKDGKDKTMVERDCSLQIEKLTIEAAAPEKTGTIKDLLNTVKASS